MDHWNQLLFTSYEVVIAVSRVHRGRDMCAIAPANTALKLKSTEMSKTKRVTLILEQPLEEITRLGSPVSDCKAAEC